MTDLDWKQRVHHIGTRVRVILINETVERSGELLTAFNLDKSNNAHPRILLDSGQTVLGYECWWIPVDEICFSMTTDGTATEIFTCTSLENEI